MMKNILSSNNFHCGYSKKNGRRDFGEIMEMFHVVKILMVTIRKKSEGGTLENDGKHNTQ